MSVRLRTVPSGLVPPVTKTRPSFRTTETWLLRATGIDAASVKLPSLLYSSALADGPAAPLPPVIKIRPSGSSAEEAPVRGRAMLPADAHVPLDISCGACALSRRAGQKRDATT